MEERPKVFGIGMFKTGTTSLGAALQCLGYRTFNGPWRAPTLCPFEPWGAPLSVFRPYTGNICRLVDQFDALEDYPFMFIYPLLDELYPGSKFILTTRDPASLAASEKHFWRRNGFAEKDIPSAERFIQRYESHRSAVLDYFRDRPSDLLVLWLSSGHGWDELCSFLGHPVPDEVFPHLNPGKSAVLGRIANYSQRKLPVCFVQDIVHQSKKAGAAWSKWRSATSKLLTFRQQNNDSR